MKSYKIIGVGLIVALVALAASVTSAFAATSQWLVGGAVVTSAVNTDSTGTITLEEMNTGAVITCETKDTGTVGPGVKDTVATVTFENCKAVKVCENVEKVAAVNLPWSTELVLVGGKFEDLIGPGPSGKAPGYEVKCKIIFVSITSVCSKEDAFVNIENLATSVNALFNTEEEATCTTSGKATGLVHGTENILAESGAAVAASEA